MEFNYRCFENAIAFMMDDGKGEKVRLDLCYLKGYPNPVRATSSHNEGMNAVHGFIYAGWSMREGWKRLYSVARWIKRNRGIKGLSKRVPVSYRHW